MDQVSGQAAGDVKVGSGTLDIERVRMDRQSVPGRSVLRQYALPGGVYAVTTGETVELWVEYSGATNPSLKIDWGAGEPNSPDNIGCGSCLLTHKYANDGRFTVTVTLDDRVSTTVTRRFQVVVSLNLFLPAGSCTLVHNAPGCSNYACQQRICSTPFTLGEVTPFDVSIDGFFVPAGTPLPFWGPVGDEFCCAVTWDVICAWEATSLCR